MPVVQVEVDVLAQPADRTRDVEQVRRSVCDRSLHVCD
jgi:hypothetical protein